MAWLYEYVIISTNKAAGERHVRQRQEKRSARFDRRKVMYIYQYVFVVVFICLVFNKSTRFASLVFLCSYVFYYSLILDLSGNSYYHACAAMELVKGYVLNGRYLAISLLSYSLILINFIGFIMFEFYIEPLVYDIVCAIVLTLQILILSTRLLSNGIYRNAIPQLMVRIVNFDCSQSRVRMFKNKTAKKSNK